MKYTYSFLLLTLAFLLLPIVGKAQCDSDAGQYPPDDMFVCGEIRTGNTIPSPIPTNTFLEPNDGISFIQFTDPLDPLNTLVRLKVGSLEPTNIFIAPFPGDSIIYFAAIVGDTLADGRIDLGDPCLSISNSFKIIFGDLTCSIDVIGSNGCITTQSKLYAKASGGIPPYEYLWSDGSTADSLVVFGVGAFPVTITDAINCTTTCIANLPDPVPFEVVVDIYCFGDSIPMYLTGQPPFNGYVVPTTAMGILDTIFYNDITVRINPLSPNVNSFDYYFTDSLGCKTEGTFELPKEQLNCIINASADSLGCANPSITLEAAGLGGTPPFVYFWNNGISGSTITVSDPGTYNVTVTDANDCLSFCDIIVEGQRSPFSLTVTNIFCPGDSIPILFAGSPPFNGYIIITTEDAVLDTMFFENTMQDVHPLDPGMISFEYNLTDGSGCNIQDIFAVHWNHLTCHINVSDTLSCLVTEASVNIICSGGPGGRQFEITGPNGFLTIDPNFIVFVPGVYQATITDNMGCQIIETFVVEYDNTACATIIGNVLLDQESDCVLTGTDTPLDCWIVEASNGTNTFYATTQHDGSYSLPVIPGEYTVELIAPSILFEVCDNNQLITVANINDTANADFLVKKLADCPLMEVSLSSFRPRRCFADKMYLEYCNNGTIAANDVFIELTVDSFIEITNAAIPFTINGNTIIFEIGTVEPFDCEFFDITYETSCDASLGQTLCAESIIYPNEPCPTITPLWSGASLQITGECTGDSIHFSIKNVGIGTMTEAREYIVIEDAAIMRVSNPFTLGAGGERTGSIATNGSTIRIEVEQEDNHPGESMPSITIERCGTGPFSSGFVTQLPLDDADPFIDIQCEQVRGSYDPNDKRAEPKGFSSEHFIDQNIDLEYTIRFQNTGNDTAFTVEIIDTLSHLLDVASINPGVSSHDYRFEVFETGILRFTFNDILLVDSFTNEPASNGFVKYSIAQKEDVPLGSVIYNAADIYFDFNAPIYTNQTFHTVGRDFITVKTQEVFIPGAEVNVYPNPFKDKATFEIKNVVEGQKTLRLLDISGKVIYSQTVHHEQFILERKNLNGGFYFYEISSEGAKIATGKLVVE